MDVKTVVMYGPTAIVESIISEIGNRYDGKIFFDSEIEYDVSLSQLKDHREKISQSPSYHQLPCELVDAEIDLVSNSESEINNSVSEESNSKTSVSEEQSISKPASEQSISKRPVSEEKSNSKRTVSEESNSKSELSPTKMKSTGLTKENVIKEIDSLIIKEDYLFDITDDFEYIKNHITNSIDMKTLIETGKKYHKASLSFGKKKFQSLVIFGLTLLRQKSLILSHGKFLELLNEYDISYECAMRYIKLAKFVTNYKRFFHYSGSTTRLINYISVLTIWFDSDEALAKKYSE